MTAAADTASRQVVSDAAALWASLSEVEKTCLQVSFVRCVTIVVDS
jgi:hypothetical protein